MKSFLNFLKQNKIEHVLLVGYATDMCFCKTTAGYENLSKDFNVFLVGEFDFQIGGHLVRMLPIFDFFDISFFLGGIVG